jgi:uncharacterized membrane protein YfcA
MTIGFGGGILWMPFLLIVSQLQPQSAILTSLCIQTFGTASGSIAYIRQKKTDNRLALFLLAIAIPGLYLGAYVAHKVTPSHIELILGLVSMLTALLFVSSNQKYLDVGRDRATIKEAYKHSWIATIMAFASGMLTINMGEWLVPVMKNKMSLKMSNAVATTILITFGVSVVGAASHLMMGSRIDLPTTLWGIPGVVIGGQIGPMLVRRIDERFLKEIFIFLLTLIGIHLVYNSYPG